MGHFRSNLRDLEFNLFEVFRVQDRLDAAPFDGIDLDTVRGVLTELNAVATGPLAASFADADRNPPVFDPATHSVTLPQSLKDA
ncbi:MAG: acyl-CoA dehydrogenase N-terminal domain-containing protein, partial [Pseudonocardia sp.]